MSSIIETENLTKVFAEKRAHFQITASGNYCFYFGNSFSVVTSKNVEFTYRLENKKVNMRLTFQIKAIISDRILLRTSTYSMVKAINKKYAQSVERKNKK